MIDFQAPNTLRRILWLDATTCVATGALMALAASPLAALLQLPASLLFYAGLSLFPVAAFIALVASRGSIPYGGVWLVVIGNALWTLTSLALLTDQRLAPNSLGVAFIVIQAAAVAILAELEYTCIKRSTSVTA